MIKLRAALAGYNAQYSKNSLAGQHKCLPVGAIDRIESVVSASEQAALAMGEVQSICAQELLGVYDGNAAEDILDILADA